MMDAIDFEFIVERASKAPSGHNTQPWKFECVSSGIRIHPDFTRSLPVVDSDDHALYISLGCATENLLLAAAHLGYDHQVQYPLDARSSITVQLQKRSVIDRSDDHLFACIPSRQVNRTKYTDKKVQAGDLNMLRSSFKFEGVSLIILNGVPNFENIVPLIIKGNDLQFNNKAFVHELTSWFRYTKADAEKTKDGLWVATLGFPNLGKWIGNLVMRHFVSAKSEAKRLEELLKHTQGLAIFIADDDLVGNWIKIGRAFQRFALTATKLGIAHAHLNMACEEKVVRYELARELGVGSKHPMLLIRYGYSKKMPYAFRRSLEDVVLE